MNQLSDLVVEATQCMFPASGSHPEDVTDGCILWLTEARLFFLSLQCSRSHTGNIPATCKGAPTRLYTGGRTALSFPAGCASVFTPRCVCACKYGPAALQFSFFSAHSCSGYIRAGAVRYILEKALTHHTSVAQNLPPKSLLQKRSNVLAADSG